MFTSYAHLIKDGGFHLKKKYTKMLKKNGQIYIEVPDSLAANNNLNRQEFFFEHYNIFSQKSCILAIRTFWHEICLLNYK